MKDHPEAQDVLQNLGRKRLMEVRSVNKQFNLAEKLKNEKLNIAAAAAGPAGGNDFLKKVIMSGRMSAKGKAPTLKKPTILKKDPSSLPKTSNQSTAESGAESNATMKRRKVANANFISTSADDSSLKVVDFATIRRTQKNRIRRRRPTSLHQPSDLTLLTGFQRTMFRSNETSSLQEYKKLLNFYVKMIEKNFSDKCLRIEMELKKQNDLIIQSINMKKFD